MSDASSLGKLVPGFEFLQGLVKGAGAALPGIGQWIAPTIDPAELEKRIEELRTVQFWLEQNARMLGATIQAMEVQRMTLSTLKTMNVRMSDLRDSMHLSMPKAVPAAAPAEAAAPTPDAVEPDAGPAAPKATPAAAAGVVDPMKWWGALTQQFTELATRAIKEGAPDPTRLFGTGAAAATDRATAPAAPKPAARSRAARPAASRKKADAPAAAKRGAARR